MKIVLVHNYYGSGAPSGENAVFEAEKALLERHGHDVIVFTRHSDTLRNKGILGTILGGLSTPFNPFTFIKIRRILQAYQPDVIHVHNFFPLISPSVFYAATGKKTATVMTLHNYRLFCPAAIPLRDGKVCTLCIDQRCVLPALRFGCYRNGIIPTVPLAIMTALHRILKTWEKHVDVFIALSEFQKSLMVRAGLPDNRVFVKPNFHPHPKKPLPWAEREDKVVFLGRLGEEKGVRTLLDAWKIWGPAAPKLEIIGDGPLANEIMWRVSHCELKDRVILHGQLPYEEAQKHLAKAKLLILPSLWFEGFPMVIRESLALGVPVAASRIGSLPEIVQEGVSGVLFEPGNIEDLVQKASNIWNNPQILEDLAKGARKIFEERYTARVNYKILIEIYQKSIDYRNNR